MPNFLGGLGGGFIAMGMSAKIGKWVGYFLLTVAGAFGIKYFPQIWATTEAGGGNGTQSLIPNNLDPLVGIWVVLGAVLMMCGILWVLWVGSKIPSDIGDFIRKKFPSSAFAKIITFPLSFVGIAGILYWAYWVGIIDDETGRKLIYGVIITTMIGLFIYLTPLKGWLKNNLNNFKWIQKERDKNRQHKVKALEKEVAELETDLKEAKTELEQTQAKLVKEKRNA